jgi:hypothetical protein
MHRKGIGLLAARSGHNADRSTAPITAARWSEALHWNGQQWSYAPIPSPPASTQSALSAIACISATNCWAVGDFTGQAGVGQALRWNGHAWMMWVK